MIMKSITLFIEEKLFLKVNKEKKPNSPDTLLIG